MTTKNEVPWSVTSVDDRTTAYRTGTAPTRADARGWPRWPPVELLAGELDDVAFTVDDAMPTALYHPARDETGRLDPDEVTATLVEIYQGQTAADVSARIVAPPAG